VRKKISSCLLLAAISCTSSQDTKCLTRKATDPSSSANVPCIFPFTYAGKEYTSCTVEGHPDQKTWCSTKVDSQGVHVDGGGHWGVCGKGCPQEKVCEAGWQRLSTGCYRFEGTEQGLDMVGAQNICEEYGGYLVEINSKEESDELQKFYETKVEDQCMYEADAFWIGVKNDTTKGENGAWVSTRTEEKLTYTNWYDTEPNHVNDNEYCAAIFADSHQAMDFGVENFRWIDLDCPNKQFSYYKKYNIKLKAICEKDVEPIEVPKSTEKEKQKVEKNGCLEGWTKLATGCYLFKRQPSTFREARHICDKAGGYVVEIDSEEEYSALEKEWKDVNGQNECKNNGLSWWIGITDAQEEGTWVLDYSGTELKFSAWHGDEPNNWGGQVPGENCAIANLGFFIGEDSFDWFDVGCGVRGFPTDQGKGISFNPLCEQYSKVPQKSCEGCKEKWVKIGTDNYKFIKTSDGTTRDEAEQICEENGGHLAEIMSEEERKALQQYYEKNVEPKTSFFLSALNLIRGKEDDVKYGWWIGATDEVEEGRWMWKHSGENMTYSAWFQFRDIPRNENYGSYGGADCAAVALKEHFLDVNPEKDDIWRDELAKDGDFKWIDISCYIRFIPLINMRMSPLCKK